MGYAESQYVIDEVTAKITSQFGNKFNLKTTKPDYYGKTITVSKKGETIGTTQFSADGKAVYYTTECGHLKFTCEGEERNINASYYRSYDIDFRADVLYGFRIKKGDSSPFARVEYLADCDNTEFTPARMNFNTGEFEYGSWEDAFFMSKPCMLRYDGTLDYYLDPNDYSKKDDGTASDYNNTSYGGNAMIEFPKIWTYYNDDGTYINCYIANYRHNASFNCYSHHDKHGQEIDFCYMPAYNGALVGSTLRSISGLSIINGKTGTEERTYAQNNGADWFTEVWTDRMLVNSLLILMGKSTHTQETYGYGHYTGGSGTGDLLRTGTMDDKGLFWGSNGTRTGVKIFGIENWWGNQWRRVAGLMTSGSTIYYKMTYGQEDGTTVTGYSTSSVSGLLSVGAMGGTSGGYISDTYCTAKGGIFPKTMSGSSETYYCDGVYFTSSSGVYYALAGGSCSTGLGCGAFAAGLDVAVSPASWYIGASLSCKPTAAA